MGSTHQSLELSSSHWKELQTAYGDAGEIPALLQQLRNFPVSTTYQEEPLFSLWSALCHQGDVYSASFAAVPHIVEALRIDPIRADANYFQLPVCIELARIDHGMKVPSSLEGAYKAALGDLPGLVAKAAESGWGDDKCAVALAAIAVSTGKHELARLLIEVEPDSYQDIVDGVLEA